MGFCHRCGDLVHGTNCLKCGGRSVNSVTSGLASNGARNDPWMSAYQNILEGGMSKPSKRMSMPASSLAPRAQQHHLQHQHQHQQPTPQPLVLQKQCHGCQKAIHQAKVFVEPGKPTFLYCEKCYTEKFTKGMCPSCFKPVMSKTDPYITHAKRSWHTACFVCFKCRIDVSQSPMVDLRGRPCCEDCLMAQAGDGSSPDQGRTILTPLDRSFAGSPVPSSSPSQATDYEDHSDPRLNPSLPLNVDTGFTQHSPVQQSPLSAQSTASHSSLANSFRQTASSGYTSGTSSAYSSLGRKRSNSSVPSAIAATSANRTESLSPHLSYQRPGSALSIHSYTSSRPTSPGPVQDSANGSRNHSRQGSSSGPIIEDHGLRRTRSRSLVGMDDLSLSQRASTPSDTGSQSGSSLANLSMESPKSPESELVSSAKKLSISTTSLDARSAPPVVSRPTSTRERSRSSVGPVATGMVRARTEAWMNQTPSMSPPPKTNWQSPSALGHRTSTKPAPLNTSPRTRDDATNAGALEAEPNRSSLHRHGRQRSNTVGEAISFPAVKVDSLASPTLERASIPENHCHKCLERVTENGIRLQNGDRFHIGCFLCFGCNQIFTESEFHVVNGRPYHPACVSMAPSTNITGVVIKCFQCHKIIGNKSIRFGGMNYHPDCFKCTHCNDVLQSTSRFFEVDGRVECEKCCEERDRERLAPKIVPVARRKDNFAVPPPAVPVIVNGHSKAMEPSGPGMMAAGMAGPATGSANNLVRSGSGYGSPMGSGHSSPVRSPASPAFSYPAHLSPKEQDASSPVIMMASPSAIRSTPPVLTSLFSTRTRPLPKFGGVTTCPRCQQAVGVMDQVPGPKNEKWHKKCLNCKDCKKNLDSSAMTRGEGEAYCRGCFNKTRVRV